MLSSRTIEEVKEVQLSDVVGHFITLKHKGVNHTACCPFHNEKSASFNVNNTKGIYKCFGCGVSGDGIAFVMQHENQTFAEAVKTIANIAGITIEEETRELNEKEKEILSAAELQEQVLNYVVPVYQAQLHKLDETHPAKIWLANRRVTDEVIAEWQLGWAPNEWRFITEQLIPKNWFEPARKLNLIQRKNENNFDVYRSRIIFPIWDKNGRYIGLGGRHIIVDGNEGKDIPKYLNPAECELYTKSTVFYGLNKAQKAIKKYGHAKVVEGYMDVISPYSIGIENTVATCGTAFTDKQIALIKKHTDHVALWRDNDDAGNKSFDRNLADLLKAGIKVSRVNYKQKDPDDYVQSLPYKNGIQCFEVPPMEDGILYYAREKWEAALDDQVHEKSNAKSAILHLLANVQNEIVRNNYFDQFVKKFKWKAADTKKEFQSIQETTSYDNDELFGDDDTAIKFAPWMSDEQKEECLSKGYLTVNRKEKGKPMVGYYSFTANGKSEITNFIIKPLFHVYAGVESRYLVEIYNGYNRAVLDIPARIIPSIDQFQAFGVSEGNFIIFGSKPQWLRIASELLQVFPRCMEITSLGWQRHKFFAFVDKIFVPGEGLRDLDNWGIFKYKEENFLVPASCEAYKQLQRTGDDPYENDRYLTYKQSPVNFSTWAIQMQKVYLQKGPVGIAYAILSLFRDIVFDVDNNCPHLYAFGEPSSGKSKWAESITAIFYYKRSAFNLNSGTDFAFFNYMQRYRNCPAHLNEFEIEVIRPEWFQAIKGVFDGEGRERGKGGSKNRTEVMRVLCTLILTGQKLVTADDNSVVTRSIIEPFSTRDDLSEADKKAYDTLKTWESQGMSSMLIELLQYRKDFEENYKENFNGQLSEWRKLRTDARQINQRILQNFSHLATCYNMVSKHMQLPIAADEFTEYCYNQAVRWSQFIRSSDTLSEFWRTLEFLVNQMEVEEGWDYVVEETLSVTVRVNRTDNRTHDFDTPTKVLYLRLNNVHKLFQSAYRSRTGKEAMNMENLLHYFTSRKYYVGAVKQKRFKRFITVTDAVNRTQGFETNSQAIVTQKQEEEKITSCYAFVYEDLEIDIAREAAATPELPF